MFSNEKEKMKHSRIRSKMLHVKPLIEKIKTRLKYHSMTYSFFNGLTDKEIENLLYLMNLFIYMYPFVADIFNEHCILSNSFGKIVSCNPFDLLRTNEDYKSNSAIKYERTPYDYYEKREYITTLFRNYIVNSVDLREVYCAYEKSINNYFDAILIEIWGICLCLFPSLFPIIVGLILSAVSLATIFMKSIDRDEMINQVCKYDEKYLKTYMNSYLKDCKFSELFLVYHYGEYIESKHGDLNVDLFTDYFDQMLEDYPLIQKDRSRRVSILKAFKFNGLKITNRSITVHVKDFFEDDYKYSKELSEIRLPNQIRRIEESVEKENNKYEGNEKYHSSFLDGIMEVIKNIDDIRNRIPELDRKHHDIYKIIDKIEKQMGILSEKEEDISELNRNRLMSYYFKELIVILDIIENTQNILNKHSGELDLLEYNRTMNSVKEPLEVLSKVFDTVSSTSTKEDRFNVEVITDVLKEKAKMDCLI